MVYNIVIVYITLHCVIYITVQKPVYTYMYSIGCSTLQLRQCRYCCLYTNGFLTNQPVKTKLALVFPIPMYSTCAFHCTMRKQVTFSKDWDYLARRASEQKMHFLVLVLKFGHQSAQGSPKQTCFRFRSQNQNFAITAERKECPLILTLCRLMIKFCYQYQKIHFLIRGSPWQAIPVKKWY